MIDERTRRVVQDPSLIDGASKLASRPASSLASPRYWLNALLHNKYLNEAQLGALCRACESVMLREPNVVHVASPVTIVGDIHGQFYDLRKLLEISDFASGTQYVFL